MKLSPDSVINSNKTFLVLGWAVIIVGTILRFHNLDHVGLWSDELYTVSTALDVGKEISWLSFTPKVIQELNFADSFITWKAADNTPPLFELILIVWAKLFGDTDFSLRALPASLGSVALVVFFFGLRRPLGAFYAFLGTAIFALSPSAVAYSQEVRSYTLTLFLCTWATVRIINHILTDSNVSQKQVKTPSVWPDIGIYVLMAYSHYTGLFVAGLLAGAYLIFVSLPRRHYIDIFKFLVVPLTVVPWLWLSRKAFIFSSAGGYGWREYYFSDITDMMIPGLFDFILPGNGLAFGLICLTALIASLLVQEKSGSFPVRLSLKLCPVGPRVRLALYFFGAIGLLLIYSIYNSFTAKMWHPRYFIAALPIAYCMLLLLFPISKIGRRFGVFSAILIIIFSASGLANYFEKGVYSKEGYREASAYIAQNITDDSVIILGWEANAAYYRHYLDKMLLGSDKRYVFVPVSAISDVRQVCTDYYRKGRRFFIFQVLVQSPYFEELSKCPGIKKLSSFHLRGALVEEYGF